MADVRVDHNNGHDDVPDDVFDEGPPGEEDAGGISFADRTQQDKLQRWRAYFDNGGTLQDALDNALHVAAAANAGQPGGQQPQYGRIVTVDYNGDVRLMDGDMFDRGPPDASGNADPNFDANHPADADKKQAWRVHWNAGGIYAPMPEHIIDAVNAGDDIYVQAFEPFETDAPGDHKASLCCNALGWVKGHPKTSVAIALAVIAGSIVGGLFGTGTVSVPDEEDDKGPQKPASPTDLNATVTATDITVTWKAPVGGGKVDSYRVELRDSNGEIHEQRDVSLDLSAQFTSLAPGSYTVVVTAINTAGSQSMSIPVTVMKPATGKPPQGLPKPGKPENVKAGIYQSKVNVYWQHPLEGGAVESYEVALTDSNNKTVFGPLGTGLRRMATFDDVSAGSYTAQVTAHNASGTQTASAPVNTVEIDWSRVLTQKEIDTWKSRMDELSSMDEEAFWKQVFAAIRDPLGTGKPGQPATYEDQEVLAHFLTMVIQHPDLPDKKSTGNPYQWATRIAVAAEPIFPQNPPSTPYADPIAVWTAASGLKNELGTADEPLRYKLFGMERALERYLGIAPAQQNNTP